MEQERCYKKFLEENLFPRELKHHNNGCVNFSSSDYLGLSTHPLLIERSRAFLEKFGAGSTSSRLVTGNLPVYETLEKKLAQLTGKPAALILGTGYQTNSSVLEAILDHRVLGAEPLLFCDRLCHASLFFTTRYLSRLHRFQHNNLNHLNELLEKFSDDPRPKFIVAESVYSMDGDQADILMLIFLAKKHKAFLYIDDAHAIGVYGSSGLGLASDYAQEIDLVMGTFSKAAGSFGGYVACSPVMRDYLINKCQGLIYSTGLPPAVLGAIDAALELLPTMKTERERLLRHAERVRDFFKKQGLNCGNSTTHIVPWILGDAEKTLYVSQKLREKGITATAIRPPSVPKGESRIRFCLSSAHSDEDIERLMEAILTVNITT